MKRTASFLLIVSVALLATNCTIEKRVFGKGYYIEWKKKVHTDNAANRLSGLQKPSDDRTAKQEPGEIIAPEQYAETSVFQAGKSEPETILTDTRPKILPAASEKDLEPSAVTPDKTPVKPVSAHQKDADIQPQTPRTFEPAGIASFIFYFTGFGLGLCAIFAMNPVAVLGFTALLLLIALILGIVSVVRFHRNRDLYQGNFFGYFGLIASAATLVLGLFILTVTAFVSLSAWPG